MPVIPSIPDRPPVWRQTWHDLLFAHWPVPAGALRPFVPAGLTIDEYDRTSWVGLVPFRMTGVTLRGVPALPWLSAFPEMNLRVYVSHGGQPGVWFVSLDAARWLAVQAARRVVHLPYFHAAMSVRNVGDGVSYVSERHDARPRVAFRGTYRPAGPVTHAAPGSLAHFLTARYCLYTKLPDASLARLSIDHPPWPLQPAHAQFEENLVAASQGIRLPDTAPLLHFSRRLDVVGWGLERVQPDMPV